MGKRYTGTLIDLMTALQATEQQVVIVIARLSSIANVNDAVPFGVVKEHVLKALEAAKEIKD